MRDKLHRLRETRHSTRERLSIIAVVLLISLSLVSGLAAAQAIGTEFSDDFEDGNADGWENVQSGTDADITSQSFHGDHSAYGDSTMVMGPDPSFEWTTGPVLDISDDFEITGTFQYDVGDESVLQQNVRIGITGDDQEATGENALLLFDYGSGETRLGTHIADTGGDSVSNDFRATWTRFKIQSDEGDDVLRAKVWEAGTSEPLDWQIERSGFEGQSGAFGFNPGGATDADRQMWLDQVSIDGTEATDPNLEIDTSQLLLGGESNNYDVLFNRSEVSSEASVESLDTDGLTVDESNTRLVGTSDSEYADRVNVRAEYNGSVAYEYVTVIGDGEVSIDHLDILPPVYRITTFLGDWTVFLIFISSMAGVIGTRIATSFMGLSMMEMVIMIGWFGGYISTGLVMVSVCMALFVGLNLAANIDYSVRR